MRDGRSYADAPPWRGPYVRYDLVREFVIALVAVTLLAVVLSILFSSPDERPSTIAQWSRSDPADFVTTAVTELDGSSATAGYGPPYNHAVGASQKIGPIGLERFAGVSHPIDAAKDFVLNPLASIPGDAALQQAINTYQQASPKQQMAWTDAYTKALKDAKVSGTTLQVAPGDYGPVAPMMTSLLGLAQSGGVDGALLTSAHHFYETEYTKPLLFMNDGGVLTGRAQADHLLGTQWGMMNETGSYPGQVWLWLYTFWYQIDPFKTSHNADALIWTVMAVLTLGLILIPFIPGVRSLPRYIPIYKLIWREHYRNPPVPPAGAHPTAPAGAQPTAAE